MKTKGSRDVPCQSCQVLRPSPSFHSSDLYAEYILVTICVLYGSWNRISITMLIFDVELLECCGHIKQQEIAQSGGEKHC